MTDHLSEHWLITGRVQGVGYRDWLVKAATALGVTGSVRNTEDGAVEAHVHGPAERLAELHAACAAGPPSARPDRIERNASGRLPTPARFTREHS
jgi:acylphosphatase